ncbi:4-hydroxy-tetrahydrodipicolinate synthase [Desulfobacterales bacterium HSG16]|nr:4-hydroxy-tetrahydrodipicolinate synthase [Desulfobacterales bacterium HSG16]
MITGAFTALITPFTGNDVDYDGLDRLIDFQIQNRMSGILAAGTTGESPVLSWEEHNLVVEQVSKDTRGKCICIAGAGSNNTKEAIEAAGHAVDAGVEAVLLVDPYYNGPSSLEIRREYLEPVAREFPDTEVIPYVIPGRTGTQILPEDLALLNRSCKNVATIKEATGNLDNMKKTRACCGEGVSILSGDDSLTASMMTDPDIKAAGIISVASNIAPAAVADIVRFFEGGKNEEGRKLAQAIAPLSNLVTITTKEKTPFGIVTFRARNPLGIKTLMAILGMPSGPCRRPLGRLTENALDIVLEAGRSVFKNNPEILQPAADFFNIDIEERLNTPAFSEGLCYESY